MTASIARPAMPTARSRPRRIHRTKSSATVKWFDSVGTKLRARVGWRLSFYRPRDGPQLGRRMLPIGKQPITRQMRHPQIDFQIETLHIGEIGSSAGRLEDAVVKHDIGVEVAGEDQASHH